MQHALSIFKSRIANYLFFSNGGNYFLLFTFFGSCFHFPIVIFSYYRKGNGFRLSSMLAGNQCELSPKRQLHDNCFCRWHNPGLENLSTIVKQLLKFATGSLVIQEQIDGINYSPLWIAAAWTILSGMFIAYRNMKVGF